MPKVDLAHAPIRKLNFVIHCQYVYGIGHFVRTKLLASKLATHFSVYLINGGESIPKYSIPDNINYIEIPAIFKKENADNLIPVETGMTIDQCFSARIELISDLLERVRPDIVITEHFPFGNLFEKEALQLIQLAKTYNSKLVTLSSVRDIIESNKGSSNDPHVCTILNQFYDALLIHSDENIIPLVASFPLADAIQIPYFHTGFIAKKLTHSNDSSDLPVLLGSIGGGRIGGELLTALIEAHEAIFAYWPHQLVLFSGAFQSESIVTNRSQLNNQTILKFPFNEREYIDYLERAALLVCMGGYNTVMEGVSMSLPMLVYNRCFFGSNQEQRLRVQLFEAQGLLTSFDHEDLIPERMVIKVRDAFSKKSQPRPLIDFDGAENSLEIIYKIIETKRPTYITETGNTISTTTD